MWVVQLRDSSIVIPRSLTLLELDIVWPLRLFSSIYSDWILVFNVLCFSIKFVFFQMDLKGFHQ